MPGFAGLSPAGSVALGVIVGLLSTSVQSLGLTLQRKSHLLEDGRRKKSRRRSIQRPSSRNASTGIPDDGAQSQLSWRTRGATFSSVKTATTASDEDDSLARTAFERKAASSREQINRRELTNGRNDEEEEIASELNGNSHDPTTDDAAAPLLGVTSNSRLGAIRPRSLSLPLEPYRPPYRRRRWQIGMFMFVVSNLIGSTIQITTLPLPVLSTLQASGLVFNTICASLVLGEPFTRWSFGGTMLVASGAVLIAMYGALPEEPHELHELLFLLRRWRFIVWMFGTGLMIVLVLTAAYLYKRLHSLSLPRSSSRASIHSEGQTPVDEDAQSSRSKRVTAQRTRVVSGFAFGATSAILSAHSLLVAKSSIELLILTLFHGRNQFQRWESWVILGSLLFFALTQLYFLHRGLKLVSTSVLYPFVFCVYNVIAILDGLVYFRQLDQLSPLHAGLIALGTVVLLAGVVALSWRLNEPMEAGSKELQDAAPLPAEAQPSTLLTPGMTLVDDATTDESESEFYTDDFSAVASEDEEALVRDIADDGIPDETTALLRDRKRESVHFAQTPEEIIDAQPLGDHQSYGTSAGTSSSAVTGRRRAHTTGEVPSKRRSSSSEDDSRGPPHAPDGIDRKKQRYATLKRTHTDGSSPNTAPPQAERGRQGHELRQSSLMSEAISRLRSSTTGRLRLPWEYAWDLDPLVPSPRSPRRVRGHRYTNSGDLVRDAVREQGHLKSRRSISTPLPLFGSPSRSGADQDPENRDAGEYGSFASRAFTHDPALQSSTVEDTEPTRERASPAGVRRRSRAGTLGRIVRDLFRRGDDD